MSDDLNGQIKAAAALVNAVARFISALAKLLTALSKAWPIGILLLATCSDGTTKPNFFGGGRAVSMEQPK